MTSLWLILQSKSKTTILLTKTTAAQNEAALSYHKVRGLYFLAVAFVVTIGGYQSKLGVITSGYILLLKCSPCD